MVLAIALLVAPGIVAASSVDPARPGLADGLGEVGFANNGVTPPPTAYASAAYDASDGYVVMFGGEDVAGATESTTWVFTHGNWSAPTTAGGLAPPARFEAQMTYDAGDAEVLLFGGCGDSACHRLYNDTWGFAHGRWTNLTSQSAVAPPARERGMMVDDPADGYVLLYGGEPANASVFLQDTWGYQRRMDDGRAGPGGPIPAARVGGALIYDSAKGVAVLYGGISTSAVLGDTWTYLGGNWTDITANLSESPAPRWAASAAYDSEDGYPLVVNGYIGGSYLSQVWAFGGTTWSQLSDPQGPPGSFGGVLVDDPADGYLVYFSGVVQGLALLTSTLLYYHGNWVLLINPPGSTTLPDFFLLGAGILLPAVVGIGIPLGNRARRRRRPDSPRAWTSCRARSFAGSRPLIHGRCTAPRSRSPACSW